MNEKGKKNQNITVRLIFELNKLKGANLPIKAGTIVGIYEINPGSIK